MLIRPAHEADAPALGQVMVAAYLAAQHDQMPDAAWTKRAEQWTQKSQQTAGRARCARSDERPRDCIYVALDGGCELVGLAMAGPADAEDLPQKRTTEQVALTLGGFGLA
jgi:hypothetical protein